MDAAANRYGLLFEKVSVALCAVDGDGNIRHINHTLQQMLGWDPAQCQGQPLASYLRQAIPDPAQALSWTVALSKALALGKTTQLEAPTHFRAASGQEDLDNVTGAVMALTPGAPLETGAVVLIYGPEVLASTVGVHARMFSAMAHEIGLPMSNIAAAAELVAEILDPQDGRERRLIGIVQDEVARLQRLIAQFLIDPHPADRPPAPSCHVIALRPILSRVTHVFGLRDNGQDIAVQVPPDLPFVWGDTAAIQQVLSNLLDSAFHRCPDRAPLQLGAETSPGEVRLCIADPGASASCEEPPGAFRPRLPASGPNAPSYPEGLSLSLSASLVEAMGGRLWYTESPSGQRCTCFALLRADGVPQEHDTGDA
ncbi:MAG: ATP-binding protein [Anaerolineae bacterium]